VTRRPLLLGTVLYCSKQCREIPIFLLVHTVKDVNSTEYRVREKKEFEKV
jgi:hypothetical protein